MSNNPAVLKSWKSVALSLIESIDGKKYLSETYEAFDLAQEGQSKHTGVTGNLVDCVVVTSSANHNNNNINNNSNHSHYHRHHNHHNHNNNINNNNNNHHSYHYDNPAFVELCIDDGDVKHPETVPKIDSETTNIERDNPSNKDEENAKRKYWTFFSMFRYATKKDIILTIIGTLATLVSSLGSPLLNVIFGQVVHMCVDYENKFYSNQSLLPVSENMTAELTTLNVPFLNEYCKVRSESNQDDDLASMLKAEFSCRIRMLSLCLCVIGIIYMICSYISTVSFDLAAFNQMLTLKKIFFSSVLRQDISWFDRMSSQDSNTIKATEFASRLNNDLKKIEGGYNRNLCFLVYLIASAVVNIFFSLYHCLQVSLAIFSLSPLLILSSGLLAKLQNSYVRKEMKAYGEAGTTVNEILSSIRTVYAFGGEAKAIERYDQSLILSSRSNITRNLCTSFGNALIWAVVYVGLGLGLWYGCHMITEDPNLKLSVGDVVICFWCATAVGVNIGFTMPYLEAVQVASSVASSIFDIIEQKPTINPKLSKQDEETKLKLIDYEASIEFRNVHFSYPSRPDIKVIDGLNLKINAGELVALVGSSGCGKSTIVQLIQRFYDPDEGVILLDDVDIRLLNAGWLREQFGVVGQEPVLFDASIEDNICLGQSTSQFIANSTMDQVERAAMEANAHEFINRLPDRYRSDVGERGTQLSGGQKQRVAIARALIKQPKMLLFDEATSALDVHSESMVQAAMNRVSKGRTTVIVAHRLSTIIDSDRIVCLDGGKVVEQGTHDQLMRLKGFYYELVTTQTDEIIGDDSTSNSEISLDDDEEEVETVEESNNGRSLLRRIRRTTSNHEEIVNENGPINHEQQHQSEDRSEKVVTDYYTRTAPYRLLQMLFVKPIYPIVGIVCSMLFAVSVPFYAYLFGNFVVEYSDTWSDGKEGNTQHVNDIALKYGLYLSLLGLVAFVCAFLQNALFSIASQRLTTRIRLMSFSAMLVQEISWFEKPINRVGKLCSQLWKYPNDIRSATGYQVAMFLQGVATVVLSIMLGFTMNWKVSLVAVLFTPLIAFSSSVTASIITEGTIKRKDKNEEAIKIGQDAISQIRTIVSLNKEEHFETIYNQSLEHNSYEMRCKYHKNAIMLGISLAIPSIAYAATFVFGGHMIANHEIKTGILFVITEAIIFGSSIFGRSCSYVADYQQGKVAGSKLFRLIDSAMVRRDTVLSQQNYELTKCFGDIRFENVRFSYPTRLLEPIFAGLSFRILPGQKIGLVGRSGCGKSTIIQLLEKFYIPQNGSIFIDGVNLRNLNIAKLRSQIALVSQEPILFNGTIRENISYGDNERDDIPFEEIEQAAKKANVHEFIMGLGEKYETRVGQGGNLLSGGQKQRIAIARAMIRDPPILLLDEATSALDSNSEKQIQKTLDCASIGRTCIIIAHRLSTIQNVDRIIYIDRQGIVEEGTHHQLLTKRGHYWRLCNHRSTTTT